MAATQPDRLSIETIVGAAIEVARHEGIDALSMRKVGAELGYSGMSLYTHVSGKDELLELMGDHVLGLTEPIDTTQPWQRSVADFFTGLRMTLLEHRGLATTVALRPITGANAERHSEAILATLAAAGLSPPEAEEALIALSSYTLGATLYAIGRDGHRLPSDPRSAARASERQFRRGLEHLVAAYATLPD